jgi:hypothetical protein
MTPEELYALLDAHGIDYEIIEIFEEEKQSFEDTLLQNATCQHTVTFNKILMLRINHQYLDYFCQYSL